MDLKKVFIKTLTLITAVLMTFTLTLTSLAGFNVRLEKKDEGLCDVDGDGKVTAMDARLVLRASAGLGEAFGKEQTRRSDIDFNGKITAADARFILRLSAGLDGLKCILDITQPQKGFDKDGRPKGLAVLKSDRFAADLNMNGHYMYYAKSGKNIALEGDVMSDIASDFKDLPINLLGIRIVNGKVYLLLKGKDGNKSFMTFSKKALEMLGYSETDFSKELLSGVDGLFDEIADAKLKKPYVITNPYAFKDGYSLGTDIVFPMENGGEIVSKSDGSFVRAKSDELEIKWVGKELPKGIFTLTRKTDSLGVVTDYLDGIPITEY